MTGRIETLGSLLAAMAVVVMTGELPATTSACAGEDAPLNILAKPKLIVPLRTRFEDLFHYYPNGNFKRFSGGFQPREFLKSSFGMKLDGQIWGLFNAEVMPSTIQIALAKHMAGGDINAAERVLYSRSTIGIAKAEDAVRAKFPYAGTLGRTFWRVSGNADRLWLSMRDEMLRVRAARIGGAL